MIDRRRFLGSLITLGGITLGGIALVGPDALDALDRAMHRKVWQGGIPYRSTIRTGLPRVYWRLVNQGDVSSLLQRTNPILENMRWVE